MDIAAGLGGLYNEKFDAAEVANDKESHTYYLRTTFTEDAFFASLEKKPWGQGFEVVASVADMHAFAKRALAAEKEVFFAGVAKF